MTDSALDDITHTIQLVVAPVFLLTAIGSILSVLTARMSRVFDRARALEATISSTVGDDLLRHRQELGVLQQRARSIHRALTSAVASAFAVCLLITLAFAGFLLQLNLGQLVAVLFIASMALLMFTLAIFLREIFLSVHSLELGMRAAVSRSKT